MELKKTWKRVIAFVLAFAMAICFTPVTTALAAYNTAPDTNLYSVLDKYVGGKFEYSNESGTVASGVSYDPAKNVTAEMKWYDGETASGQIDLGVPADATIAAASENQQPKASIKYYVYGDGVVSFKALSETAKAAVPTVAKMHNAGTYIVEAIVTQGTTETQFCQQFVIGQYEINQEAFNAAKSEWTAKTYNGATQSWAINSTDELVYTATAVGLTASTDGKTVSAKNAATYAATIGTTDNYKFAAAVTDKSFNFVINKLKVEVELDSTFKVADDSAATTADASAAVKAVAVAEGESTPTVGGVAITDAALTTTDKTNIAKKITMAYGASEAPDHNPRTITFAAGTIDNFTIGFKNATNTLDGAAIHATEASFENNWANVATAGKGFVITLGVAANGEAATLVTGTTNEYTYQLDGVHNIDVSNAVSVKTYGGAALRLGTDYKVTGTRTQSAATASKVKLEVTGMGVYSGTAYLYYNVKGADSEALYSIDAMSLKSSTLNATGKAALTALFDTNVAVSQNDIDAIYADAANRATNLIYGVDTIDPKVAFNGNVADFKQSDANWYYYLKDATEGVANADAAKADVKDNEHKKALNAAPTAVGNYIAVAAIPATSTLDAAYITGEFTIDPLTLTVVPEPNQSKEFGAGAETYQYKAYKFFDKGAAIGAAATTKFEYAITAEDIDLLKQINAQAVSDNKVGSLTTLGSAAADNKLYTTNVDGATSKIDESKAPFIIRQNQGTQENVGNYPFAANGSADKDKNYTCDIFTDVKLNNVNYAITARDLDSNATVTWYDYDANSNTWTAKANSEYENAEEQVAYYEVYDQYYQWKEVNGTYKYVNDAKTLVGGTTATVAAKYATSATDPSGTDGEISKINYSSDGDTSSTSGGPHSIILTGNGNYAGTKTLNWSMATSKDTYVVATSASELADAEKYNANTKTLTLTYDGNAHGVKAEVTGLFKYESNAQYGAAEAAARLAEDTQVIEYKNKTAYTKVVNAADAKLTEVPADKDWTERVPEFTYAGTYEVDYQIRSEGGKYATQSGSFTIIIEPKKVAVQVPTLYSNVGDTAESIIGEYDVANKKFTQVSGDAKVYTQSANSQASPVGMVNAEKLVLAYAIPSEALVKTGTYDVTAGKLTEKTATDMITAAHKKLYEACEAPYNNTAKNTVAGVELPAATPVEGAVGKYTRDWSALSEEDINKLINADVEKAKVLIRVNDNYNVTEFKKGSVIVSGAILNLYVFVTGRQVAEDNGNKIVGWVYNAYNKTDAYAENKTNVAIVNNGDGVLAAGTALTDEIAAEVLYTVTVKNGGPVFSDVKVAELDSKLAALNAGDYVLSVRMPQIDGVANGTPGKNTAEFKVAKAKLVVTNTHESNLGAETPKNKAPEKLENLVVTANGIEGNRTVEGNINLTSSDTTYALQYSTAVAEGTPWTDNEYTVWKDSLADLKDIRENIWTAVGDKTVYVRAATKNQTSLVTSDAIAVKVTVGKAEPGEKDIVSAVNITNLKDQAGQTIRPFVTEGTFTSKDYGTFTENDLNAAGGELADDLGYAKNHTTTNTVTGLNYDATKYHVTHAATGPINSLEQYVITELLASNGYAVGMQDSNDGYIKNVTDGYQQKAIYRDSELGRYGFDNYVTATKDTGFQIFNQDAGNDINTPIDKAALAHVDSDPLDLADITLSIKEIKDPKHILAVEKVKDNEGNETERARVAIDNNVLNYTLVSPAVSGTAVVTIAVSRAQFAEIYFDVNITMAAEVPEISIFNTELGEDPSTEINKDADFTTVYVNEPLKLNVTVKNYAEGGASYIFSKEILDAGDIDDLYLAEKMTALTSEEVTSPEEDGTYILYVRAIDANGNKVYASSANGFTLDKVAPVLSDADDKDNVFAEDEDGYIIVDGDEEGSVKVEELALKSFSIKLGDADAKDVDVSTLSGNYNLKANVDPYVITATDKAGNKTVRTIYVLKKVDNRVNNVTVTYAGEDFDPATVADEDDDKKLLFVKSENAGDATFDIVSNDKISGTKGAAEMVDGKIHVTKAGIIVVEMKTEKKGIYGPDTITAELTVKVGTREVGIALVENPSAETKVAKTQFTSTEAGEIEKYVDLIFTEGTKPADTFIKYVYYTAGSTEGNTTAPTTPGKYEVAVRINEDGVYNAANSEEAKADAVKDLKRAAYEIVATNKVTLANEPAEAGKIVVTNGTDELDADALKAVAKNTELTFTATPVEGYVFTGWSGVKGFELAEADTKKAAIKVTVTGDIELTANYVATIVIKTQPADVKAYANDPAEFTVVVEGAAADTITYQWMVKGKDEAEFEAIPGATAATYKIDKVTATDDGKSFMVVVKSGDQELNSNAAKLEVVSNNLEDAVIELASATAEYTGKAIVPVIRKVTVNGTEISAARDYDVVAADYINAGEYDVTIKAKEGSNWTGEASTKFTITPKAVTADMFTIEDVQYTGKAIEAPVVAKDGETELVADKDFTVAYKNNTEVGTATATITGKGNYTGSVDVKFNIIGESIAKATVTGIKTVAYTGKAITPTPVVKLNGKTLKKGTDYTVSYKNNTKVGTATVTITGKGDYSGKITKKFLIKQISFKYRAYVQKKNWMSWSTAKVSGTSASKMAGTTDNLRMETIQMQLSGVSGQVKYRAYVEKMGWTQWATTADTTTYAGTKGLSRRVEMIQLQASGQVATLYDMYYRTYCEKFGWLGWVKSGEKSGSAGYARKLEAFQINFVRKGESFTVKSDQAKGFYDSSKDK